jgi:hypothetical protein
MSPASWTFIFGDIASDPPTRGDDAVFAKLVQLQAGGLVIGADNLFASQVK